MEKNQKRSLKSIFYFPATLVTGFLLLLVAALAFIFIYRNLTIDQTGQKAQDMAVVAATLIEADIDSYKALVQSDYIVYDEAYYQSMLKHFRYIKEKTGVTFIYSQYLTKEGEIAYILDGESPFGPSFSPLGMREAISAEEEATMISGRPYSTGLVDYERWGTLITGFAPIRDIRSGELVGVVGVDYALENTMYTFLWYFLGIFLFVISITSLAYRYLFNRLTLSLQRDTLTGLQSREAFSQGVLKLQQKKDLGALILISLDDFKFFNNKYGEDKGNDLLKEIVTFLELYLPKNRLYRYGGDEFMLLLQKKHAEGLRELSERIAERFRRPFRLGSLTCEISASIAVKEGSLIEEYAEAISVLEYCINLSKQQGKGKVIWADEDIRNQIRRQNYIIEEMKKQVESGGFHLAYQPIYSLEKGTYKTAEALLRLEDPEYGNIPPGEFIPLAERSGLIIPIGYLVLEKICGYIQELEEASVDFEAISVNFSPLQLADEDIVPKVMEIIRRKGISPHRIRIEITESAFIGNHEAIRKLMKDFRTQGIRFYLDDFGTGYSNLASIIRLHFEYIKLDKSLLEESENYRGREMLERFISLFVELGIQVVIEGVEEEDQCALVRSLGAQFIQGYYHAKPLKEEDLIPYLKGERNKTP